uniref:Preprotein translocase SecG subunit n=1 Tax=Bulboplastis apyrenoidosa TaxID=1070855 RepID=A0A1Y9TM62_9RHOD|nr:preprotein translocase SecG subunit [Bulboplastis apyrenoidosa]ARO90738.1 preprotein translocase SecG subunit [Bulboplastis apyrenoidosa]
MSYIIRALWYIAAFTVIILILIQNPSKNNILSQQEKSLQGLTWRSVLAFFFLTILLSIVNIEP